MCFQVPGDVTHKQTESDMDIATYKLGADSVKNLTVKKRSFKVAKNKPAAQAAGADPPRCSFTNRQSPLEPVMRF